MLPTKTESSISATPRIDAVLFDYGQVLTLPPDPAAWAAIASIAGLDQPRFQAAYWAFRHDYDRAALTGTAYWQAVARHAGVNCDDAQIAALKAADVALWTKLNLPMVDWAGRLQSAGVRTGILSNIGDSIAEGIIARLSWIKDFNHCTWSHALFLAKPDPAIYLKTAEALHTTPTRILFIDDREENIAAAAALGFQTILYTTHTAFVQEMNAKGFASLLNPEPTANPATKCDSASTQSAATMK